MAEQYDAQIGAPGQQNETRTVVNPATFRSLGFSPEVATFGTKTETVGKSLVASFIESWRNERCAPEILPYETQLVHDMQECLTQSNTVLKNKFTFFQRFVALFSFVLRVDTKAGQDLRELSILRLSWLLKSYLRIRLHKIQKFHRLISSHSVCCVKY